MAVTVLLLLMLGVAYGYDNALAETDVKPEYKSCELQEIQCLCGSGGTEHVIVIRPQARYMVIEGGGDQCTPVNPTKACAFHSCIPIQNSTANQVGFGGQVMAALLSPFYPTEIKVPREGHPHGHRSARQTEECRLPQLKNAELKCWKWPNWINCDVECAYGHALRIDQGTGQKTNANCRYTENRWKPRPIQDCQPFLNCKVRLVRPGDLTCKEPLKGPAFCDISCLEYDNNEAVETKRYECTEKFASKLPHCAALKENVDLIPRPK